MSRLTTIRVPFSDIVGVFRVCPDPGQPGWNATQYLLPRRISIFPGPDFSVKPPGSECDTNDYKQNRNDGYRNNMPSQGNQVVFRQLGNNAEPGIYGEGGCKQQQYELEHDQPCHGVGHIKPVGEAWKYVESKPNATDNLNQQRRDSDTFVSSLKL
jgi:hypothetical protein